MADKDIRINIKTTADTSGAKEAEAALKKVSASEDPATNPMLKTDAQMAAIEAKGKARDAAVEHEAALRKEAAALKQTAEQTKLVEKSLPPMSQATTQATASVEKLGQASQRAGAGGLKGLAQGVRGVVAGDGATRKGGLLGMAGSLVGVLNPIGLLTAGVGLLVGGLMKWKRSQDEAEEALVRLNIESAEAARIAEDTARKDELAAQSKERLRDAQVRASNEIDQAIRNIGNYNSELQRSIDLEAEAEAARKAIAAEKLAVAIAEAGDDPVKVNELRQQARQVEQAEELAEIDNRIAAEKKRQEEITAEITRAMEQKLRFEQEAAALENQAPALQEEAEGLRALSDQMAKNIEKQIKDANAKKGGASDAEWGNINRMRENQQKIEKRAKDAETALEELRQTAEQKKTAANDLRGEVSNRDKLLQSSVDTASKLERDRGTKTQIFEQRDKLGTLQTQQITEREQKRREQEKQRAEEQRQRDEEQRMNREAGLGRNAAALLPKDVTEKFRRSVEAAANGLQDGDQGGEIEQLAALMEQLASAVRNKDSKTSLKIANLERQIKDLRS